MGFEPTLLPLEPRHMKYTSALCYERLNFDQDYEIFSQISAFVSEGVKPTIKTSPIPPQMWIEMYEDEGIKKRRDDNYGTELTFVYAKQLKKLKVTADASSKNKAIKAFIDLLPDNVPIILFWR